MKLATFTHAGATRVGCVVGDRVRIEVDKIGVLENPVIAEPSDTARIS